MCEGEAGEAVAGLWRRETKRRHGFERRLKGEKVARRLVMVWRGMDMFFLEIFIWILRVDSEF